MHALLDHLDEKAKAWAALIGGAILFLVESGLQVSGYTNHTLAIALWGTAFVLCIYWLHYITPKKWRAAWQTGMASWQFIAVALTVALVAVALGGYGIGLRAGNLTVDKPEPPAGSQEAPSSTDTHLHLQFGTGSATPIASNVANIFRWYALATMVVSPQPDGKQQTTLLSWSIFLAFDNPVDLGQLVIHSQQRLPTYEVKDTSARSAVIAFLGDLTDVGLDISALPRAEAQGRTQTNPGPVTTKSEDTNIAIYTTEDIRKMLIALGEAQTIVGSHVRAAYEATQFVSLDILKKGGAPALVAKLQPIRDAMRQASKDLSQLLFHYRYYDSELRPVLVGYDSALGWQDGSLTPIIDDLNRYSSGTADVLEALVRDRFVEWANGRPSHFDKWYGGAEVRIAAETKKIREWPRVIDVPEQKTTEH